MELGMVTQSRIAGVSNVKHGTPSIKETNVIGDAYASLPKRVRNEYEYESFH